jgi:hypothetical protein
MTTLPTLVSVRNVRDGSKARTVAIEVVNADHLLYLSMSEECCAGTRKRSREPRDQPDVSRGGVVVSTRHGQSS